MLDIEIGTKYMSRGKHPRECTVEDIHKTYDSKGNLVKTRYVASHEFLGQKVYNYDVCGATIAVAL